jgi:hypothetical protein
MHDIDKATRSDEVVTEVELSADDLLELTPPAEPASSEDSPSTNPQSIDIELDPATMETDASAAASPSRRLSASRIALALSLPVVAAAVIAAQYNYSPASSGAAPAVVQAEPTPELQSQSEMAEPEPPVRFANPFDKSEVFEFPPGTTREEARAAVAELLLQRAHERQTLLDARSTPRR